MKIKIRIGIGMLCTGILIIFFSSCETNVEEDEIIDDMVGMEEEPCMASYMDDIKIIIANNCLSCHSGTQFPDLRTYQGVSTNAGIVKTQVVNRTMPIGGTLTNDEIELISCWVDNGAPNN
ncbi:cytochrome c [Muricauda sp. 334s03]|uniref:Cytochrome c n=1 Tax=Flagellimonas yonaguniensis TaxID=3031325 RepID=A0ABT5Y2X8_9FLAO|nr:cytochrome c [[Muricauda] yonaguniensis]MDF0717688.1 cytochrome c [[Muricauda] yonaguniensis]